MTRGRAHAVSRRPARREGPSSPTRLVLRSSFLAAVWLLGVGGLFGSDVWAQGKSSSLLGSSSASSVEVEARPVVEASARSFEWKVRELLGLGTDEDEPAAIAGARELSNARRGEIAGSAIERFEGALEREISELSGDGVLFADEVTTRLGELRESHLHDLRQAVEAEAAGFPPPPRREEHDTQSSFVRAMARYVFVQRNGWLAWVTLLGAALGGLALGIGVLKISSLSKEDKKSESWLGVVRHSLSQLHGPLYLLLLTGGLALGLRSVWLPDPLYRPIRLIAIFVVVVALFWITWRLSATVPGRIGQWVTPTDDAPGDQVIDVIRKVIRLGLIVLFAILGVELIFDADLTTFLTGLGIVGLAISLAAQDTLKDLFAAATIHTNQPFRVGDLVRFEGYFGTVEDIGFRMTRIRTLDGHLVTVPNSRLVSTPVENVGARPHIRRRFRLDLPYDTPIERISSVVAAVKEEIEQAGGLDEEQGVQVHFDEFGPHSLRLLIQYYFESGDYWAAKEKATEIDLRIVERVRAESAEFAYPTQTLHLVREADAERDLDSGEAGNEEEEPTE